MSRTRVKASWWTFSNSCCAVRFPSFSLLHFWGFWVSFDLHDLWNLASQAKRSCPLILLRSLSSWSFSALFRTVFQPSNSNAGRPSVVHVPFSFYFFALLRVAKYTVRSKKYLVRWGSSLGLGCWGLRVHWWRKSIHRESLVALTVIAIFKVFVKLMGYPSTGCFHTVGWIGRLRHPPCTYVLQFS